jgi:hypothetical protein
MSGRTRGPVARLKEGGVASDRIVVIGAPMYQEVSILNGCGTVGSPRYDATRDVYASYQEHPRFGELDGASRANAQRSVNVERWGDR